MLLDLTRIRTADEHYDRTYAPGQFPADDDYMIVEPVRLTFDIHKDKSTFRLVGRVQTVLELPCSRCLETLRWPVDEPFELTYEPQPDDLADGEREIEPRDFSTAYYQNEQIDLEQLIRERFEMSIPMKPLCGPECKGLCPTCGKNLNRESCDCHTAWEDPRLAVLKNLKRDS